MPQASDGRAADTGSADMTAWEGSKENVLPARKSRSIMASPALAVRPGATKDVEQQRRCSCSFLQQEGLAGPKGCHHSPTIILQGTSGDDQTTEG
jgi:hypothetical protein